MKNKKSIHASLSTIFTAAALLFCNALPTHAETWNLGTGGSWNTAANWNPASVPNAIGANVTFNNAASANNPAQTANSATTLDGSQTVGTIDFNTDAANTFTRTISTGTGGPLVFDATDSGPAIINVNSIAGGTGNNTISVAMSLTDSLVVNVTNVTATSGAGALNLTAVISGDGGFTKNGGGLATFGTGIKTYAGATVLNGGRMRVSLTASPTATSSFTINSGAQLTLISAGSYTFGGGPMNLNGTGLGAGSFPGNFPGAIRNDTGLAVTINNAVVLQSDTLIHVQGSATGSTTFPNSVSGPGRLTLTALNSDNNLGTLVLNGSNTYEGGTTVNGGTLVVGSSVAASLGTGNVTINSGSAIFSGAVAKLTIQTGVTNAIADTATLSLAGGNVAGTADDGFAELQSGINEVVGGLVLGGVTQASGTYGSTSSSAANQNDEFFTGPGIVTVVAVAPPPSLTIAPGTPPNVVISWPTNATGFVLQETATLSATNIWTDVTNSVVVSGTNNTVTVNAASGNDFFRLKQ